MRNMTGSPIAGIDPHELLDVRNLNYGMQLIALKAKVCSAELYLASLQRKCDHGRL